jgi:hypothetical protein
MFSEALSQFRKDIIENLSFSGVLFWFVFLPIIVVLLSLAYEDLTNGFFLSKLERKTALLKQMYELEHQGIRQSDNLKDLYDQTLAEFRSYNVERPHLFRFMTHRFTIAFSTGLPLGLLLILAVTFASSKKGRTSASAFGIALALAGGAIALVITALSNLLIGVSAILIVQAGLVLYVVGSVFRQSMKDSTQKTPMVKTSSTSNRKK